MAYSILLTTEAREQLRALPNDLRRDIGFRLEGLQKNFAGDIKKLEGAGNRYRLRVGIDRVLFRLDAGTMEVYAVKQRKNAYD